MVNVRVRGFLRMGQLERIMRSIDGAPDQDWELGEDWFCPFCGVSTWGTPAGYSQGEPFCDDCSAEWWGDDEEEWDKNY